jgi:hypothetical protein
MLIRMTISLALASGFGLAADSPFSTLPLMRPPVTLSGSRQQLMADALKSAMTPPGRAKKRDGTMSQLLIPFPPGVPKARTLQRECSIPLAKYSVPQGKRFLIRSLPPRDGALDPMAIAPPAPACEDDRGKF